MNGSDISLYAHLNRVVVFCKTTVYDGHIFTNVLVAEYHKILTVLLLSSATCLANICYALFLSVLVVRINSSSDLLQRAE